jgi:hypothetical protein
MKNFKSEPDVSYKKTWSYYKNTHDKQQYEKNIRDMANCSH